MDRRHICVPIIVVGLWLGGCAPAAEPVAQQQAAQQALTDFFRLLHEGRYQEATELYGGTYEVLTTWNPEQDPSDHAGLFESGCSRNGLRCLEVRQVSLLEASPDGRYVFEVQYRNEDGSLFVLGPCCGATATEMPPVDTFSVTLETTSDGRLLVMDLPVYVP